MNLNDIRITDDFFGKYTSLVTKEIIPYQWRVLNDAEPTAEKSHCIENFKIAAGESQGEFYGFVFQDTDLAKWLEAVAYSLSYEKNEELEPEIKAWKRETRKINLAPDLTDEQRVAGYTKRDLKLKFKDSASSALLKNTKMVDIVNNHTFAFLVEEIIFLTK